jgi:hypothetical protein
MSGVTPQGFVLKTIEEIKLDIETDELATIDPTLVLSADQPIGEINAAVSKQLAEVWEVAQIAYNAFDRDASEDRLLDNLGSLTGTPRSRAKKSVVTCTVTLGAAFSQPAGLMMCDVVGQPAIKFVNRDPVVSTTAGTYTAIFESVDYGPVVANAGTLAHITNPITGWTAVTNPDDAVPGALAEKDVPYRQRQVDELTAAGASTVDAIRADLLKVPGVQQAFVFENVTLATDSSGLPGKAIECVIYDGAVPAADNIAVAQAIWNAKPSGSEAYGTSIANAVDALGVSRPTKFSRAIIRAMYLEFDVAVNPKLFPVDGVSLIKDAAVARGNLLNLGDDVIDLAIRAIALSVPGVVDVTELRFGMTVSPTNTDNLAIDGRSIARFDTSRVVVNVV